MTNIRDYFKLIIILPLLTLAACSTNPATGRSQFTALLPASQEASIGAQEHEKILKQYGGAIKNRKITDYVTRIGNKIVPFTERDDVTYTFTVLDSPIVNAFALPGGYVYVTRGLMTLANNEAELAAVIAHEIGHVTARHSAERYSRSILTGLGANVLAATIDVSGASQALGVGANLYLSSYSRSQEHEADDLGVRYLARAGYNPDAMSDFLRSLEASSELEARRLGVQSSAIDSYFSTHPVTAERVQRAAQAANQYPENANETNRLDYLRMINGMEVGDGSAQGFEDKGYFVHPELGFIYKIPQGFKTDNRPNAVISQGRDGALVFTAAAKKPNQSIENYLRMGVMKGDMSNARDFGTNLINGFNTASVEVSGTVNNKPGNMRLVAIEWDADTVYQFAIAIPRGTSNAEIEAMQASVFSFNRLTNAQRNRFTPKTLALKVAKAGDTPQTMARGFPYDDNFNVERFRVLNGLEHGEGLQVQNVYKIITQ
jgi:predicted Zn-dependent protease